MSKKKLLVGLVAVALMLWVGVPQASAQTIEELQAQIQALLAQLQQLQGGGTTACTFTRDLTVGSSGADVTCLQDYLISTGHFTFAGGATGYFGEITKAAVAAWQTANGLPSTGYFGPLSRAKYTALAGTTPTTPTCPPGQFDPLTGLPCGTAPTLPAGCTSTTGYSITTGLPCGVTLPAGCTSTTGYSSTTGLPCGTTTTPTGSDGKLTTVAVTLESSPADGTDLASDYTGIALMKEKIRVSSSPGTLKQFGLQTTNRSWLYWLNAYLYVGDTLIGEKKGLTSSSFSEVTVGAKYNLTFDNLNYALPVDTDVYVTLKVDAVSDTGRAASSGLIIQQDTNQVVVLDANDNYSVSTGFGTGTASDRTWDWIAAQVGNSVPSNNTATPGTRWAKVSENSTTDNVTMQIFDIKAEAKDIEINTLRIGASTSGDTLATDITSWDLYEGSCLTDGSTTGCTGPLAGGTLTEGTTHPTITFSNLVIQVPKDTKKTFTVKAKWADEDDFTATMASGASTTAFAHATWIGGIDKPTYNTLTVSGSNVTGGDVRAILYAPTLSSPSASCTVQGDDRQCQLSFKFTIKADGGTLYLAKETNTIVATTSDLTGSSTTGFYTNTHTVIDLTPCSQCNDGGTYYAIPDGITRTFELSGGMSNTGASPTSGVKNFKVTRLYFDDDTTGLQEFYYENTSFSQLGSLSANQFLNIVDAN